MKNLKTPFPSFLEEKASNKILDLASLSISEKQEGNEEEIVLPDECGDTLWDKVLAQEEATNNQK